MRVPQAEISSIAFRQYHFTGGGHRRVQPIEVFAGAPADVVMLGGSEGERAVPGPRPVNHADVFVRRGDTVDVEEARGNERAGARPGGGRAFAEEFNVKAAFLSCFTERGLLRVFIQLDVPTERQPAGEVAVMDQQNLARVDNEDRHGEIYLFVDVGHCCDRGGVSTERRLSKVEFTALLYLRFCMLLPRRRHGFSNRTTRYRARILRLHHRLPRPDRPSNRPARRPCRPRSSPGLRQLRDA